MTIATPSTHPHTDDDSKQAKSVGINNEKKYIHTTLLYINICTLILIICFIKRCVPTPPLLFHWCFIIVF